MNRLRVESIPEMAVVRLLEASTIEVYRILAEDRVCIRTEIPDMVPPFRRHTISIDGGVYADGGMRAVAEPVGNLARWANTERDIRRWSACDL